MVPSNYIQDQGSPGLNASEEWQRTTRSNPCPICGAKKWCSVGQRVVHCMHTESDRPASNGDGWLHPRQDLPPGSGTSSSPPPWRKENSEAPSLKWAIESRKYAEQITESQVQQLATQLGVEPSSLRDLGIGFGKVHAGKGPRGDFYVENYTFPMFDKRGRVCGLRRRDPTTGRKFAVTDSRIGVLRRLRPVDGLLLICEGESDTAAALSYGFDAIGRPGATTCIDVAAVYARDLDVVVVADNDDPTDPKKKTAIAGVARLVAKLTQVSRSVRILRPPQDSKDLRAWRQAGATREELEAAIESAEIVTTDVARADVQESALAVGDDGRQTIIYESHGSLEPLHELVPLAARLLAQQQRDEIFVYGGELAHIIVDESSDSAVRRSAAPRIRDLPAPVLRERLDACARWIKIGKQGPCDRWAPKEVVDAMLSRGTWNGIRPLLGVTVAPMLRPDGSILAELGYDERTAIWNATTRRFPPVPDRPTDGQVQQAVAALLQPFADFPIEGDEDRAAVLALMLTLASRAAIDGPVPMTVVLARTPGSGKTLLVESAVIAMTGNAPDKVMPPGGRAADADAEWRKRILSLALEAPRAVLLDNVPDGAQLQSPALAVTLTSDRVTDRKLGTNENARPPHRIVWATTGNNVSLAADLARRSLSVLIDPAVENPHLRDGFRIPDLLAYARREHPRLLTAALTLLRGFFVAGQPRHPFAALGMFEAWDHLVRSCVIWGTGHDPVATQNRLRSESPENTDLARLLEAWVAVHGNSPVLVADLLRTFAIAEVLAEVVPVRGGGSPSAAQVGRFLGRYAGRVVDGRRIVKAGAPTGKVLWRVERVD